MYQTISPCAPPVPCYLNKAHLFSLFLVIYRATYAQIALYGAAMNQTFMWEWQKCAKNRFGHTKWIPASQRRRGQIGAVGDGDWVFSACIRPLTHRSRCCIPQ